MVTVVVYCGMVPEQVSPDLTQYRFTLNVRRMSHVLGRVYVTYPRPQAHTSYSNLLFSSSIVKLRDEVVYRYKDI